ncbi:MAG: glycosyltransferase family 4 protein [Verrucomicrobiota bacterium]
MGLFQSKRVLYVANSLVVNGGVERRNLDQIQYLRKQGLDVHICVLRAVGEVAEIYRAQGIPVFHFHAYDTGKNRPLRIHFPALLRFWWFVLRGRYRIIVGSQFPSHYLARLACLPPFGRRVFAMERGITDNRKAKYRRLDRLCALWTRRIICISGAVADQLHKASRVPQKKLQVIEEGYAPLPAIPPPPPELQEPLRGTTVIGCVGNFTPLKRQEILVRAFAQLHRSHPETRLVLVGDGDRREDVEQVAEHLDIRPAVIFTGAVDNAHAYYPLFDIFAFPSVSEGLGGAFVEARLHNLPVICADVRPMSDYIRHGADGLLFKPDDADDLERQITVLLENPELSRRISVEGCEQAKQVFDTERQMARLHTLLTA